MYDAGVMQGFETYNANRAGTFAMPEIMGCLAGAPKTDWQRGYLHGLALGAELQMQAQTACVAMHNA